jgi:stage V sporulation protein SpoVS
MNRFFSKLNLNDIKIKPDGNSFPPDADEMHESEPQSAPETANPVDRSIIEAADNNSFDAIEFEDEDDLIEPHHSPDPEQAAVEAEIPVASNGHSNGEISYEESTALYATAAVQVEERVTEIVSDGVVIGVGEVLKVSARSRPSAVAGAIAGVVREVGRAEVQAIGAGATNQAIKAVAIARDYLNESGIEAVCVPAFIDVTIDNEDRTAIRLVVEPR